MAFPPAGEPAMIPYFQKLGERIERAWLKLSYDDDLFPRLALDELERDPPSARVEAAEIIDWLFGPTQAVSQPAGRDLFGEPPVMLFQAPRFYVEALFWLSGTTVIHQHCFSGAFSVLAGSSVHSHWRFAQQRAINSRMSYGSLERVSTEILRPGATRPIHAGDRLIHQLFHLELPSVTVVVRTCHDDRRRPQYHYVLPGLAIHTEDRDSRQVRRLMFLDGMARGQLPRLRDYACKLIESGDLEALFYMFSLLTQRRVDRELLDELYGLARRLHGDVVDLFARACEGERRTRMVTALRSRTSDPEVRFLLALLMLMPDREAILEAIGMQFPNVEPLAEIERWLARLGSDADLLRPLLAGSPLPTERRRT
jgi:hypothetical protein